jgi:hypothetical protein
VRTPQVSHAENPEKQRNRAHGARRALTLGRMRRKAMSMIMKSRAGGAVGFAVNVNGAVTVITQLDGATKATYTNAKNANLRLQNFGPHNIILNLAVGSNYGTFNNANINLYSKTMMWVDYVTVDKRTL